MPSVICMDPERWRAIESLYHSALAQEVSKRPAWLADACAGDVALRAEVESLLACAEMSLSSPMQNVAGQWRNRPTDSRPRGVATVPCASALVAGAVIGPYRLIRELGYGGMGVVWLAERADGAMKRPVALKFPLASFHNEALTERFRRERDILGQLVHPNIARLYDAEINAGGQSYLALEYVDGETITGYCDRKRLGIKPRLLLFLDVLRAVQYAHSNLIVHRDLKPSNILVANDGSVRLLDFGIAKLLTDGESNETELTRVSGRPLSLDYASPEQITGDAITTVSDVYSLGVLLYELLTGKRPYRLKWDTRGGLEEAILTADPIRPSQRAQNEDATQARATSARKLARHLKGDLDSIVLKALQKQPERRYATADALAQDIHGYLGGAPVLAQPEKAWYRARKFVLRNKLVVGSAAAIIAALSIGLGVALREAHVAQVKSVTAEAVESFLLDIFRSNYSEHPDPVKARQTTARELLDLGARNVDHALSNAPEAKLNVLNTLSRVYMDLGLNNQAVEIGRKQAELAKSIYGPFHPNVAAALVQLAMRLGETSAVNDEEGILREAEKILDLNRDFTSQTRANLYEAMAIHYLPTNLARSADYGMKSVTLHKRYPPSIALEETLNILGQVQNSQKNFQAASRSLSEAAELGRSLGGAARGALPAIYTYLGAARNNLMDIPGAEQSYRLGLATARSVRGEDHEDVIQTKQRLGVFLFDTARPEEGLTLLKDALDLAVRTKGPEDIFHTSLVLASYGHRLVVFGCVEEGLSHLSRYIDLRRRAKRSVTRVFAETLEFRAEAETQIGHYAEAKADLDEASAIRTKIGDTVSSGLLFPTLFARANLLRATGKANDAMDLLGTAPAETDSAGHISRTWLSWSIANAELKLAQKQYDDAIAAARLTRSRVEASSARQYLKHHELGAALIEGKGLVLSGNASDAKPLLERAVALSGSIRNMSQSLDQADARVALGECLLDLGDRKRAQKLLAQANAIHARHEEVGPHLISALGEFARRLRQSQ
jgi:serine/threonine-protein kinase